MVLLKIIERRARLGVAMRRASSFFLFFRRSLGRERLQGIPPGVGGGDRRTVAIPEIQIGAATRTEPLTVLATENETRHGEKPLLTNDRTEVDLLCLRRKPVDVRIVGFLVVRVREDDMLVTSHVSPGVFQAATTLHRDVALEMSMPIVATRSSRREPSRYTYRSTWLRVALLPDRIVRRQNVVDRDGLLLQRSNVKGQHSLETYRLGRPYTSHAGAMS